MGCLLITPGLQLTFSTKIAFLGIGLMGDPMVRRLLQSGYFVTVWNRTQGKAEALAPAGAQVAASVAEAVREADIAVSYTHLTLPTKA